MAAITRTETASWIITLLLANAKKLVMDVGAHVGHKGWIAGYKPGSEAYEKLLKRSQGDAFWRVFQMALGPSHCTAMFNVSVASALSSFHKPDFSESAHASQKRQILREIEVAVDTVDRQLPDLLQAPPNRIRLRDGEKLIRSGHMEPTAIWNRV